VSELEAAVSMGQLWRVKVAIAHGADLDEQGTMGIPLHIAAANGNFEIVRLLVEQGADWSARDSEGQTAADVAARNHHREIARYLRSLEAKT
jgi:ankyrin repeat protein